mmetsp:Transcript_28370/g.61764  ORF Transcript_28370/g.61764 Transcript_28370/m.61764 type:complete len:503 (+) Transcript_28370:102-1610(+)
MISTEGSCTSSTQPDRDKAEKESIGGPLALPQSSIGIPPSMSTSQSSATALPAKNEPQTCQSTSTANEAANIRTDTGAKMMASQPPPAVPTKLLSAASTTSRPASSVAVAVSKPVARTPVKAAAAAATAIPSQLLVDLSASTTSNAASTATPKVKNQGSTKKKSSGGGGGSSSSTSSNKKSSGTAGRWSREEHEQFLEGLKIYGREWKKVAKRIPTRTSAQIRSHAQKYFAKLAREEQARVALTATAIARDVGLDCGGGGSGGAVGRHSRHHHGGQTMMGGMVVGPDQHSLLLSAAPVPLTTSAMAKVGRILADPGGVQHEVEDTLAALQRRYDELQRRLHRHPMTPASGVDGDGGGEAGGGDVAAGPPGFVSSTMVMKDRSRLVGAEAGGSRAARRDKDTPSTMYESATKKRRIDEMTSAPSMERQQQQQQESRHHDQHENVEHREQQILETRELWSQELIALSVLGGSLQQSGSREDLAEGSGSTVNDKSLKHDSNDAKE